jgi:hypothetical protein
MTCGSHISESQKFNLGAATGYQHQSVVEIRQVFQNKTRIEDWTTLDMSFHRNADQKLSRTKRGMPIEKFRTIRDLRRRMTSTMLELAISRFFSCSKRFVARDKRTCPVVCRRNYFNRVSNERLSGDSICICICIAHSLYVLSLNSKAPSLFSWLSRQSAGLQW